MSSSDKRGDVLLVQQHRARPDGRFGKSGSYIAGEGVLRHFAFAGKGLDIRGEGDRRIVGGEIIRTQAVNNEEKKCSVSAPESQ